MPEHDFNDRIRSMEGRDTVPVNRFEAKKKKPRKKSSDGLYKYGALLVFLMVAAGGLFLVFSKEEQSLGFQPKPEAVDAAQKRQEILDSNLSDAAKAAKLQELSNSN